MQVKIGRNPKLMMKGLTARKKAELQLIASLTLDATLAAEEKQSKPATRNTKSRDLNRKW